MKVRIDPVPKGLEGSSGVERASFLEATCDVTVYKSWSLGFEYVDTRRDSDYRDVPDIQASYHDVRVISTFRF